MELALDIQDASDSPSVPTREDFARWAEAALEGRRARAELLVRVVGEEEGAALNRRWRGRQGATNVLSFPFEAPPGVEGLDLIGDLVICAPVVEREAAEQGKSAAAHWAHMVVHGVLHLIGYDHPDEAQAAEMEGLETGILGALGFPPPYEDNEPIHDQRPI
jgi:probable rRNA maturation factor